MSKIVVTTSVGWYSGGEYQGAVYEPPEIAVFQRRVDSNFSLVNQLAGGLKRFERWIKVFHLSYRYDGREIYGVIECTFKNPLHEREEHRITLYVFEEGRPGNFILARGQAADQIKEKFRHLIAVRKAELAAISEALQ